MKVLIYKGYRFINLTPHPLIFKDGIELEVYDQELAKKVFGSTIEEKVDEEGIFVKTKYEPNQESLKLLKQLNYAGYMPISSVINAQSYPFQCYLSTI